MADIGRFLDSGLDLDSSRAEGGWWIAFPFPTSCVMPIPVFPQRRDSDLLNWSRVFAAAISAAPALYGLDAAQASAFAALQSAYASAYATARDPETNSKASVIAKNEARLNLLEGENGAWELVPIVQAFPGTTDVMRSQLGLQLADRHRSPVGPPSSAPDLSILSTLGRSIRLRLRDADHPDRRGKPDGVDGAVILYQTGETFAADEGTWMFAMLASRPVFEFELPWSVPAGSKVWLSAFWFNARKQAGPCATPRSAIVGEGLRLAA